MDAEPVAVAAVVVTVAGQTDRQTDRWTEEHTIVEGIMDEQARIQSAAAKRRSATATLTASAALQQERNHYSQVSALQQQHCDYHQQLST